MTDYSKLLDQIEGRLREMDAYADFIIGSVTGCQALFRPLVGWAQGEMRKVREALASEPITEVPWLEDALVSKLRGRIESLARALGLEVTQ
jgi:hypothetical protein